MLEGKPSVWFIFAKAESVGDCKPFCGWGHFRAVACVLLVPSLWWLLLLWHRSWQKQPNSCEGLKPTMAWPWLRGAGACNCALLRRIGKQREGQSRAAYETPSHFNCPLSARSYLKGSMAPQNTASSWGPNVQIRETWGTFHIQAVAFTSWLLKSSLIKEHSRLKIRFQSITRWGIDTPDTKRCGLDKLLQLSNEGAWEKAEMLQSRAVWQWCHTAGLCLRPGFLRAPRCSDTNTHFLMDQFNCCGHQRFNCISEDAWALNSAEKFLHYSLKQSHFHA